MIELRMYLVAPTGFEQLAAVVISTSDDSALSRAKEYPTIKPYSDGEFTVLDLTDHFKKTGYKVTITKETGLGIYH